jgi:hypothetical protein
MRCTDSIERHQEVVDHDGDAVSGQQDHDDDLVPARIPKVRQKPIHRWQPILHRQLSTQW